MSEQSKLSKENLRLKNSDQPEVLSDTKSKEFVPPLNGIDQTPAQLKQNIIQRMQELPEDQRSERLNQNVLQRMQQQKSSDTASPLGTGNKMPKDIQSKMESNFDTSFSNVNIYPNSGKASEVGAHAFTQGTDIHFAPSQYEPHSKKGQELLGHELTHVLQQKKGNVQPTFSINGLPVNNSPELEKEADEMGNKVSNAKGPVNDYVLQKKELTSNNSTKVVQASGPSWWDTIKKGAGIYLGLTLKDEGSAYAKALMRHYALGGGSEFNPETSSVNFPTDEMWSTFMASRPEIQKAMFNKFSSLALHYGSGADVSEAFTASITDVRLNQLESMRWTLHGCHRIDISGTVDVKSSGTAKKIIFSNVKFHWIDVGDMHPGTKTQMDNGQEVDDEEFTGAGSSYPINIPFSMPGTSIWSLNEDVIEKTAGWPDSMYGVSTANRE